MMTGTSRSDDLIRAMLERRSGDPVPSWLADRTMHAVASSRQAPTGWRGRLAMPKSPGLRLAVIAATVVVLLALTGGALLAAGVIDLPGTPAPTAPAVVVGPEASASVPPSSDEPATVEPTGVPSLAPPPTARPIPDALVPDTLAVVTRDGTDLRVRSAPGVGEDSTRLEPLLQAGERMLVVSGPVAADGYDWYEVLVDPNDAGLYGWVAANGKDGKAWIKPSAPACADDVDGVPLVGLPRLDYLVCYGDMPIEMSALRLQAEQGDDSLCMTAGIETACSVEPSWMNAPVWMELDTADGSGMGLTAVATPEVWARAASVPAGTPATVTLALDNPDARDCRFTDADGNDLVPPARAALACRMQFTLVDLQWDAEALPSSSADDAVPIGSMARIGEDGAEIWSTPREEPRVLQGRLDPGTLVYVNERWPESGAAEWYAVLNGEPQDARYGWVEAAGSGLQSEAADCAPMTDWPAFVEMSRLQRLACVDASPVTLDMYVWAMQPPEPTWADGCAAWQYLSHAGLTFTCEATPAWLATFSGIVMRRPGDMEENAAYDPAILDRTVFPTTPTWVAVTGAWRSPASTECRVQDKATGIDLLPPEQAAIYCQAEFVITDIGPATTSP